MTKCTQKQNKFMKAAESDLKSMRKAASEGTIPEHVVKSRLVAIVQEAANHPDVDRHVLNSVIRRCAALELASSSHPFYGYCRSAANPSDAGSREGPGAGRAPCPPLLVQYTGRQKTLSVCINIFCAFDGRSQHPAYRFAAPAGVTNK